MHEWYACTNTENEKNSLFLRKNYVDESNFFLLIFCIINIDLDKKCDVIKQSQI